MKARAYYNELDPKAAAWLRQLIDRDLIAPGDVDNRPIQEVTPDDLEGYTQCHFFAGIGVWSYALRQAGWPDHREVWTGSCPCQPFSSAGKGGGFEDERHLWPYWKPLILVRNPATVLGEQVASKAGRAWFDLVSTDLEDMGYAVGAADLCAAGVGAPHIRQRLYWVGTTRMADSGQQQTYLQKRDERPSFESRNQSTDGLFGRSSNRLVRVADTASGGQRIDGGAPRQPRHVDERGALVRTAHAGREGSTQFSWRLIEPERFTATGATRGAWADADWLLCTDQALRPVEPGTFPLAHGAPARVGRLRGYGNAIVAPLAKTFIEAVMEVE